LKRAAPEMSEMRGRFTQSLIQPRYFSGVPFATGAGERTGGGRT